MSRTVNPKRHYGWLHTVLSILAMAAQLTVAFAPLAESRDRQMDSHVEAGGHQTHHAHNEASCAACQARSIHGSAPKLPVSLFAIASPVEKIEATADRFAFGPSQSPANPRAPPSVI